MVRRSEEVVIAIKTKANMQASPVFVVEVGFDADGAIKQLEFQPNVTVRA